MMLRRWGLAIAVASGFMGVSAGPIWAQTAGAPQPLPAEDFARDPDMCPPQVSPDGKRVAWVRGHEIVVYNRETDVEKVQPVPDNKLGDVQWINNDYFVVDLKDDTLKESKWWVNKTVYSPMLMTKDDTFVRMLLERGDKGLRRQDLRFIVGFVDGPQPQALTLRDGLVLMTDVATGSYRTGARLMDGLPDTAHNFDRQGVERLAVEFGTGKANYGATSLLLHYRATPDGPVRILAQSKRDHIFYGDVEYAEAENAIYWTQFDDEKGQMSIVRFDMATATQTVVKTSDNKMTDYLLDKTGHLVGFATEKGRVEVEWTDPFRLQLIAAVQKIFPKASIGVTDISRDNKTVVLEVSAPDAADSYYLYNVDDKALDLIGTDYPELQGQPLGEMTYITYKARDGLEIPAYVVKRKDAPAHAPLVVMPHGGPADRDDYDFDFMAQFLASRGYVVLEPQYRGSSGFGDAFQHAGDKHLAQMTTDLEDGVRDLAAQGTIDPAKVCVAGWSWGGYLADAALAFTPGTYACGISGDGVSDLYEDLSDNDDDWLGGFSEDYWRSVIGRAISDAAMIHATSPIEHVDAIRAPLLLIHGTKDEVVDIHQSERMNAAMLKAGKSVTYLPIQYMHHGPHTEAERLTVLKAMDSFIADAFAKAGTGSGAPAPAAAK